jgi:uncharacterized membrane protein YciS (DUF1049 family)
VSQKCFSTLIFHLFNIKFSFKVENEFFWLMNSNKMNTQYKVHTLMAAFGVFGFACGAVSGGFIMRRFKLNGRQAALFLLFISAINTGTFVAKSFFGCHSTVNRVGLSGIENNFNYTNECNTECSCQNTRLFPVCDRRGRPFYSPCQAGCRHVSDIAELVRLIFYF